MPGLIMGDLWSQHIPAPFDSDYFTQRDCIIDCRTPNMITIDPTANIGWWVKMIVQTHNINPGMFGQVNSRPIVIGPRAFIGGASILYNCEIGEGAVVACGAVVRNFKVPPWTVVEGNPARVIKQYNWQMNKWEKVS